MTLIAFFSIIKTLSPQIPRDHFRITTITFLKIIFPRMSTEPLIATIFTVESSHQRNIARYVLLCQGKYYEREEMFDDYYIL